MEIRISPREKSGGVEDEETLYCEEDGVAGEVRAGHGAEGLVGVVGGETDFPV